MPHARQPVLEIQSHHRAGGSQILVSRASVGTDAEESGEPCTPVRRLNDSKTIARHKLHLPASTRMRLHEVTSINPRLWGSAFRACVRLFDGKSLGTVLTAIWGGYTSIEHMRMAVMVPACLDRLPRPLRELTRGRPRLQRFCILVGLSVGVMYNNSEACCSLKLPEVWRVFSRTDRSIHTHWQSMYYGRRLDDGMNMSLCLAWSCLIRHGQMIETMY